MIEMAALGPQLYATYIPAINRIAKNYFYLRLMNLSLEAEIIFVSADQRPPVLALNFFASAFFGLATAAWSNLYFSFYFRSPTSPPFCQPYWSSQVFNCTFEYLPSYFHSINTYLQTFDIH